MGGGGERSSTPGTGCTVGACAWMRVDGLHCCCLVVVVVGASLLRVNAEFSCRRVV